MDHPNGGRSITVALVDEYDVVLNGVADMLDPYRNRVVIAESETIRPVHPVDIVLYDSFAQPDPTPRKSPSWPPTPPPGRWWSTPGASTPT